MKLRDFLECADTDVIVKYEDGSVKIDKGLFSNEFEYIFTKEFLNRYIYCVSIYDDCFHVALTDKLEF